MSTNLILLRYKVKLKHLSPWEPVLSLSTKSILSEDEGQDRSRSKGLLGCNSSYL